ncbi:hypothetical protein [Massilia horti]|uniref:Uncharacterized protein n=1 Tax=Massilia horti TaxID=2562153 RepID=A0A4Y9T4H1_9BURK|nr:hypothetical protein [Massilia horti]TFW34560.1 hypothetical protein E4O92_03805 [Massilia horti]
MNRSSWLGLAAAAAAISVLLLIAILVPSERQTPALLCAAMLTALAIVFLFLWPQIGRHDSESARMAMVGVVGGLSLMLPAGAAASLLAALTGHDTISFALDVLVIGSFVVGIALARIGANTITEHAQLVDVPSQHGQWQTQVGQLIPLCPDETTRTPVARLAEAMRYAARDISGQHGQENERISAGIVELERALRDKERDAALVTIGAIEIALAQRELALKTQRSKV